MNVIIQIIICVVVVYLIFSVIVYVVVEWISSLLQLRGKTLQNALFRLLKEAQLGPLIYSHPQIDKIRRDGKLPAYIPANNVAVALIDLIKSRAANQPPGAPGAPLDAMDVFSEFKQKLQQMPDSELKTLLSSLTDHTSSLRELTRSLEKWYNDYMDRVTGWYKKNIRRFVLAASLIVTIAFNVDTVHLIKIAMTDPKTRERMNLLADEIVQDSLVKAMVVEQRTAVDTAAAVNPAPVVNQDSVLAKMQERKKQLQALSLSVHQWDLPVGWEIQRLHGWMLTALGWLLTMLALSAGAPFWFDLLKRLVNLRNTGIKPESSNPENKSNR